MMKLTACWEDTLDAETVETLRERVQEKIAREGGWGERAKVKTQNFLMAELSERAFKTLLVTRALAYRTRQLYVGPPEGAGPDFIVWTKTGQELTIGIRARLQADLLQYRQLTYPDDRTRLEPHRINDFTIPAGIEFRRDGTATVRFYGALDRAAMLAALDRAQVKHSGRNREKFRVIDLALFSCALFWELLDSLSDSYPIAAGSHGETTRSSAL
ncbi:MAG TPA: hypothetical protein VIL07_04295 [Symbiobacteriaceae bacterium]